MAVTAIRMTLRLSIASAMTSIDCYLDTVNNFFQWMSRLFSDIANSELACDAQNVITAKVFLNESTASRTENCLEIGKVKLLNLVIFLVVTLLFSSILFTAASVIFNSSWLFLSFLNVNLYSWQVFPSWMTLQLRQLTTLQSWHKKARESLACWMKPEQSGVLQWKTFSRLVSARLKLLSRCFSNVASVTNARISLSSKWNSHDPCSSLNGQGTCGSSEYLTVSSMQSLQKLWRQFLSSSWAVRDIRMEESS